MPNRFEESLAVLEANEAQAAATPSPTNATGPTVPLVSEIVAKMPRKNRGGARNIYFSKPVLEALEREVKRRGIKPSNLVNEVLKRVLGVES